MSGFEVTETQAAPAAIRAKAGFGKTTNRRIITLWLLEEDETTDATLAVTAQ